MWIQKKLNQGRAADRRLVECSAARWVQYTPSQNKLSKPPDLIVLLFFEIILVFYLRICFGRFIWTTNMSKIVHHAWKIGNKTLSKQGFKNDAISYILVFKRFELFKRGEMCVEDHVCFGRPISRNDENIGNILYNQRDSSIHDRRIFRRNKIELELICILNWGFYWVLHRIKNLSSEIVPGLIRLKVT